MRSAYERVMEGLGQREREIFNKCPAALLEEFKNSKALIEGSEELLSSVADFMVADITATPHRAQQTVTRINKFFSAPGAEKSQETLLAKFDKAFRERKKKEPENSTGAERSENASDSNGKKAVDGKGFSLKSSMEEAAKKIEPQMLFRSFYAALGPENRELFGRLHHKEQALRFRTRASIARADQ